MAWRTHLEDRLAGRDDAVDEGLGERVVVGVPGEAVDEV